jgi:hypothetical protein
MHQPNLTNFGNQLHHYPDIGEEVIKNPSYSGYPRSCFSKIHSYGTCSPESVIAIIVIKSPFMNPSAQISANRNGGKQKQNNR